MTMADVLRILLLIVGTLIVLISYWLASESLAPKLVDRCRHQYNDHPVRCTLLGLALAVPIIFIGAVVLGNIGHPAAKALGVVFISIPVLLGLVGSAGLSRRIGGGLPSAIDETQPWRCVLRGGIVLSFTFLFPFLGWFIILPWALVSGLGAVAGTIVDRKKSSDTPAPTLPAGAEMPGATS